MRLSPGRPASIGRLVALRLVRLVQTSRSAGLSLFHHVLESLLYVLGRKILLVCGDCPLVTEGIFQRSGTVSVELVLHWPEDRRAKGDHVIELGINILVVNQESDRGSLKRLGSSVVHLGEFVGEHDSRRADQDL